MTESDNAALGDDQLKEELAAEGEGADNTKKIVKEKTEEASDTEDQGDKGEESGDEGEEGEGGKPFEDTDAPAVATRNASHIIARQKETIAKLRSKSDTEEEDDKSDDDGGTVDAPSDKIAAEVSRQLTPITERLTGEADEAELKELFTSEPEAKGYEKSIRAYMKHEAWSQVPVTAIYAYLSRSHTLAQGAKRKAVADKEAAHSRGAGSQRRQVKGKRGDSGFPSATEIDQMSDEDLNKLAQQVETGQFQE